MLSKLIMFRRNSSQICTRFSGNGSFQSIPFFHSFWRKILAITTTGPTSPTGSKMRAVSDSTVCFVNTVAAFHVGVLNLNSSLLESHNRPSVFTAAVDESNSFAPPSSRSSSGMASSTALSLLRHFLSRNPAAISRSLVSPTSFCASSIESAPESISST
uniref:(northern house mosquito) hypothetical protein n=1 Tax=Culex pipiens TaxID=7175 RepID=A0A8D8C9M7_CULPI